MVADQPAREADQDRREGRQPRPLRYLPDGRGRGAATDVPGHPVADRPAASSAAAGSSASRSARFVAAWAQQPAPVALGLPKSSLHCPPAQP